jgi:hypothetical protein
MSAFAVAECGGLVRWPGIDKSHKAKKKAIRIAKMRADTGRLVGQPETESCVNWRTTPITHIDTPEPLFEKQKHIHPKQSVTIDLDSAHYHQSGF